MYAKLGENGWQIDSPAILGNVGSSAKVVLDSVTQRPRIVYRDNESNVLNFVYHNGTEWITIVVDDDGTTGNVVGLTLDSKGMAHIAYQAFLGDVNRLMYAIQSGDSFFKHIIEEKFCDELKQIKINPDYTEEKDSPYKLEKAGEAANKQTVAKKEEDLLLLPSFFIQVAKDNKELFLYEPLQNFHEHPRYLVPTPW